MSEIENKKNSLLSKIFLPLVLLIVGGVISYFMNEYLNREKIQIVDVSTRAKRLEIKLPQDISNGLQRLLGYYEGAENYENLTIEKIKDVLNSLDRRNINIKNEINEMSLMIDELKTSSENQINRMYNYDYDNKSLTLESKRNYLIERYGNTINVLNKNNKMIDSTLKKLIPFVKARLLENKNNFFVEVVIQNKGNKQGILKYKASLLVGTTIINLKKFGNNTNTIKTNGNIQDKGELLSNYITIDGLSFNGLSLEIDNYFNKTGDIISIKKEFEVGQKNAELLVYGIAGEDPITKYNFVFKDDLSRNENESLTKLLDEKYKDF